MLRTTLACLVAATLAAPATSQSPCFDLVLGTNLNLGDDTTAQGLPLGFTFTYAGVAYTDICVCSNGYIWFGATSVPGGDFSPSEAELLAGAPRLCPMWNDFNPSIPGSGQVWFNNTNPGVATVTWAGVFSFGTTTPSSMQVTFAADNSITITYGSIVPPAGQPVAILGASPGGGAASNPVSFATLPLTITGDTFAEAIPSPAGTPLPYAGQKILFTATSPGFVASDIACTPNTLPGPAAALPVGIGCPSPGGPSLYETFSPANPNVDLSGLDLSLEPTGPDSYLAQPGLSSTWFAGFTNNLGAGDDTATAVTLPFAFPYNGASVATIYVSSNGFLTLGDANPGSGCCAGSAPQLFNGPPRVAGWWKDLNPAASGGVYADLDALSGDFVVTWDSVPEFGTASANTFQIALSPTGRITTRWQSVARVSGTFLAGYSPGNGVAPLPPTDLSTVTATPVGNSIVLPLAQAPLGDSRPVVGSTFNIGVDNIALFPNGVLTMLFISTELPGGLPLDSLGLTGCTAYVALPELTTRTNVTVAQLSTFFSIGIPADPSLYGVELMSQAASDDATANAFGFRLSNGLLWQLGL